MIDGPSVRLLIQSYRRKEVRPRHAVRQEMQAQCELQEIEGQIEWHALCPRRVWARCQTRIHARRKFGACETWSVVKRTRYRQEHPGRKLAVGLTAVTAMSSPIGPP